MSYGTKYSVTWIDWFNDSVEVLLQKRDYAGDIIEIYARGNPIRLSQDSPSDFKHEPVNGTALYIYLDSDTELKFSDMYSSSGREWKVIVNINAALYFTGFILPDAYQEPYRQAPYGIEVVAADQLGYLRSLVWDKSGAMTDLQVLQYCLEATGLEINMYEGINIYEENHNSAASDSPLNQTYVNADAFTDKTYYDVLRATLLKYGAIIKQSRGTWQIYRPKEAISIYTRRLWTYSGGTFTYDSNESHNPIVPTTASDGSPLCRIGGVGTMFTNAPWKKYSLLQTYGHKETFVLNPRFENWTGLHPDSWTNIGGLTYVRNGNTVQIIRVAAGDRTKYLSQSWSLERSTVQKLKINLRYLIGYIGAGVLGVSFALIITNGGTTYYYDFSLEQWFPGEKYFSKTYTAPAVEEIEIVTYVISAGALLDGTLEIRWYAPVNTSLSGIFQLDECLLTLVAYDHINLTWSQYDTELETPVELNQENNFDAGQIELLTSDITQIQNAGKIFTGGLWLDSGFINHTSNWIDSDNSKGTLIDHLMNWLSIECSKPMQTLSVTVYAAYDTLEPSDVIQEIYNGDLKFMIKRCEYDSKYGRWQIEAIQLNVLEPLLDEDGNVLVDEEGNPLYG